MIFILNTIIDTAGIRKFDKTITRIMNEAGKEFKIFYLKYFNKDINFDDYTHLLISGSGLSACKVNPDDELLFSIIDKFVKADKRILGICYGHQMLSAYLYGRQTVRKAEHGEICLIDLKFNDDELFEGIPQAITLSSHFDEIYNIPDTSPILCSSKNCSIQAFRHGKSKIWGIQFHPEHNFDEAIDSVVKAKLKYTDLDVFPESPSDIDEEKYNNNCRIIKNFVNL